MEVAVAIVRTEVAAVVVVATSFTSLQATTNGPCHPCADLFVILVLDTRILNSVIAKGEATWKHSALSLRERGFVETFSSVIARSPKGDEAIFFFVRFYVFYFMFCSITFCFLDFYICI